MKFITQKFIQITQLSHFTYLPNSGHVLFNSFSYLQQWAYFIAVSDPFKTFSGFSSVELYTSSFAWHSKPSMTWLLSTSLNSFPFTLHLKVESTPWIQFCSRFSHWMKLKPFADWEHILAQLFSTSHSASFVLALQVCVVSTYIS